MSLRFARYTTQRGSRWPLISWNKSHIGDNRWGTFFNGPFPFNPSRRWFLWVSRG